MPLRVFLLLELSNLCSERQNADFRRFKVRKDEIVNVQTDAFASTLEQTNELHGKVFFPAEANYDVRQLNLLSEYGVQQMRKLQKIARFSVRSGCGGVVF